MVVRVEVDLMIIFVILEELNNGKVPAVVAKKNAGNVGSAIGEKSVQEKEVAPHEKEETVTETEIGIEKEKSVVIVEIVEIVEIARRERIVENAENVHLVMIVPSALKEQSQAKMVLSKNFQNQVSGKTVAIAKSAMTGASGKNEMIVKNAKSVEIAGNVMMRSVTVNVASDEEEIVIVEIVIGIGIGIGGTGTGIVGAIGIVKREKEMEVTARVVSEIVKENVRNIVNPEMKVRSLMTTLVTNQWADMPIASTAMSKLKWRKMMICYLHLHHHRPPWMTVMALINMAMSK